MGWVDRMRGTAGLLYAVAQCAVPGFARAAPNDEPPQIVVTASGGGDTIVVSDTPVNAAIVSRDALDHQHHADLADLLDASLGSVTLSNGTGSPYQSDVSYRGFQATSLLGSPTGLSVWLDGVRMNEPFGSIVNWDLIPTNAIAAVEVLPGSNPLFGLNTLGGALVLTTKNGADNGGANATVEGGSFARRAVSAEAGGRLAGDSIDWFVAGNTDDQDGYRWYTHTRVSQGYGKLRWHGGAARAELGVIWADTTLHGTQALPLSMLGRPQMAYTWPDIVANTQLVINGKGQVRLSPVLTLSGNVYYRRSDARSTNSNAGLGTDCDGVTHDCSALAPGGTARDLYATNPFVAGSFTPYPGALPIHDYTSGINTTLVTYAIRQHGFGGNVLLDSDFALGPLANDFNLGGSFETATIRAGQDTVLARLVNYQTVATATNLLYGSATGFAGSPLINAVAVTSHNRSYTLFARDMIKLTPKLSVTASLSYTFTHIDLTGSNTTLLDDSGAYTWVGTDGTTYYNPAYLGAQSWDAATGTLVTAGVPDGAVAGPEVDPVVGAHSYSRVNPAIGATWNPRAEIGLFANYGEAMRAPTAIELTCANPAQPCALPTGFNGDPDLRAVIAHSVEFGARGTIARHLAWNAAAYRTLVDNDIQFIYAASGLGYFANLGRTERRGFELGLNADWRLERGRAIHLAANYGHVAATYRTAFLDANGDTVMPGNRIAGIPVQSLKLRASYQPGGAIVLGANVVAVSGQYAHGDEANRQRQVPGYALVNLDVQVTPMPRVELFGTMTNLFDRHYATFGVLGTNVYTGGNEQFRTPAPGRAVLGGIRYHFGGGLAAADEG